MSLPTVGTGTTGQMKDEQKAQEIWRKPEVRTEVMTQLSPPHERPARYQELNIHPTSEDGTAG
jgi:hypothetical protein